MTDDLLGLITAAIDGELSPTETRRLKRVLAGSAEARATYRRLRADARRLRALPKVQPPADLPKRIMARVAEVSVPAPVPDAQPPRPAEPYVAPAARVRRLDVRSWAPVAVAACVLIGVTASSFFYFSDQRPTARGKGSRAVDAESARLLPDENAPRPSVPLEAERPAPEDRGHAPIDPDPRPPVVPPDAVAVAPEPRATKPDLIAFPPIPSTRFDLVEVRLPFLKTLAEFERDDVRKQLNEELSLDPAYRIDLFVRDPNRGVSALRAAAKALGIALHADATTLDKLSKQQASAAVIYTESLTAEEIAALVAKLAREDAKRSPRLFDQLHAVPASGADSQDLKAIFGVDLGLFKRGQVGDRNGKGIDPSKPISAGTGEQVAKSVAGQGRKPEKAAVLLTWNLAPNRQSPQANSAELKQFLAKRGPRAAEAVPVLIVIRPGNG
jgi:hypothetical protein